MNCKYLLFLSLIAFNLGCESPDFRYPDIEDSPIYFVEITQQRIRRGEVRTIIGLTKPRPLGQDSFDNNKDVSIYYNGEKVKKDDINLKLFTQDFIQEGFLVETPEMQLVLDLPAIDHLDINRDTSYIIETEEDFMIGVPFNRANCSVLDSFCYYGTTLRLGGVVEPLIGDINAYDPEKLFFLSEFIINDSLIYYPFNETNTADAGPNEKWQSMSKAEKLEAISELNRLQLPVYHISSIRQFKQESRKLVNSASPFRLPQNLSPLDDNNTFYGQFTAMELITFK